MLVCYDSFTLLINSVPICLLLHAFSCCIFKLLLLLCDIASYIYGYLISSGSWFCIQISTMMRKEWFRALASCYDTSPGAKTWTSIGTCKITYFMISDIRNICTNIKKKGSAKIFFFLVLVRLRLSHDYINKWNIILYIDCTDYRVEYRSWHKPGHDEGLKAHCRGFSVWPCSLLLSRGTVNKDLGLTAWLMSNE